MGVGNEHGGHESTLLSLNNVFYHWGAIIVPTGYTDPLLYAAGGNPYGVSYSTPRDENGIPEPVLAAARYQGGRVARFAAVLSAGKAQLSSQQEAAEGAQAAGGQAS